MSRGAWIITALLVFYSFGIWMTHRSFLKGNVWREGDIGAQRPPATAVDVDFLGLKVARFVKESVGAAFSGLVICFIYLAIQQHRLERRLQALEGAPGGRPAPGAAATPPPMNGSPAPANPARLGS